MLKPILFTLSDILKLVYEVFYPFKTLSFHLSYYFPTFTHFGYICFTFPLRFPQMKCDSVRLSMTSCLGQPKRTNTLHKFCASWHLQGFECFECCECCECGVAATSATVNGFDNLHFRQSNNVCHRLQLASSLPALQCPKGGGWRGREKRESGKIGVMVVVVPTLTG